MHPRIELVSEKRLLIRDPAPSAGYTVLAISGDGITIGNVNSRGPYDSEGIDALLDALNCFRGTGSFGALADTSGVPFVGKRMRYGCNEETIAVIGGAICITTNGSHVYTCELEPLVPAAPAKKYRKMTPVEAAAHLGRKVTSSVISRGRAKSVSVAGLMIACDKVAGETRDVDCTIEWPVLLDYWKWADDGTPCGTELSE